MANLCSLFSESVRWFDNHSDVVLYWISRQSVLAVLDGFLSVSVPSTGPFRPARHSRKEKKMNTVELLQFSLGAAFDVLGLVTADLTQEQADWTPPGVASSIGAIYWHIIAYVDHFVNHYCIGREIIPDGAPAEVKMQDVQEDLSMLHERATQVKKTALDWLSNLAPADLERKMDLVTKELGDDVNLAQVLEIYIIWHINVHCGEISALKGCQGAKGYPW